MAVNKKQHQQGGNKKPQGGAGNNRVPGPDVTVTTGNETNISAVVDVINSKDVPEVNVFIGGESESMINKAILLFITSNIKDIAKNINPFVSADLAVDITAVVVKMLNDGRYKSSFTSYVPDGENVLKDVGKLNSIVLELTSGLFSDESHQTQQLMVHSVSMMVEKFLSNTNDARSKITSFAAKAKSKSITSTDIDIEAEIISMLSTHIANINKIDDNIERFKDAFAEVYVDMEDKIKSFLPKKNTSESSVESDEKMLSLKDGQVLPVAAKSEEVAKKISKAEKEFLSGMIAVMTKCGIDINDNGEFDKSLVSKYPELKDIGEVLIELEFNFSLDNFRKFARLLDKFEEKYYVVDTKNTDVSINKSEEDFPSEADKRKSDDKVLTGLGLIMKNLYLSPFSSKKPDTTKPKVVESNKPEENKADKVTDINKNKDVVNTSIDLTDQYSMLEALYGKYSFNTYKSLSDIPGFYDLSEDLKVGICTFRSLELQKILRAEDEARAN